ncbi:tetratricopeptide repeat protein [Streptomyces sp. DSM 41269]|uniref:ATP-binding protein n=1 Tax=Streptomyces sp. DSM 41269 TaxID=2817709 RepID=UPI00277E787B|nr:tetratricopeptide repeat protein [Streptomyces sp. DSM 41269]MDP9954353.1 tetratricopeptide (TPR) repeat protein [Streptomyces sp. DSM 41269]
MTANTYVQQYAPVPTALDALPQPPVGFTGREDDLAYILGVLDPDRSGEGPAVAVLSGGGGVGKTTLAYAAGHAAQRSGWFTGVLLVDLHGYDPQPAQAEEALEALLRSLGVPHEHLPPPGAGRDVLYRSQLNARQEKGQRLLVVADNASAIAQVQPLMPPGHHGMLVTSRQRLTGLGRMRTVNRLQPEDAVALLEAALKNNDPDDPRVGQDPEAAQRLVSACDYLPLALQITAALLAQDPGQPLSERADALGGAEGVLDGLDDGERSLRTTFDQSLERLPPQEQDLFRLLALNPGPDISTPAAAVLADQPQPATERLLARLAASHLIERTPAARDRWQMHDLLRAYAQKQAAAVMDRGRTPRRRYDQARDRLTHHYIQHAQAANTHLDPNGSPAFARFTDRDQALAWFDAERENLMATAHTTPHASLDLSFALGFYLRWRQRLQDHLVVRALALDACTKLNDTRNRATAWNNLGGALQELRRFDDALHALETARSLHQQTGDTNGEASAWNNLGNTLKALRRFDDALHAHQTARDLHQQTGDTNGEAIAWNNLGNTLKALRRFDDALHAHQTARSLYQQTGDTNGEASAWNNLGGVLKELRRFDDTLHAVETARDLYQQTGDTNGEASAWNSLGIALKDLRRFDDALHAHQTARDLHQQTGDTNGEASAWNNLGGALKDLRRFDDALHAHQTARDLHQQTGDTNGEASAWNNLGGALKDLRRFDDALHAHQTARDLHQQTGNTYGEAIAWNNLGTAYRGLGRFDEAVVAGKQAAAMLAAARDWFRTGEAWGEVATTLTAAGADTAQVREAWEQSAQAYTQAGADEEADASREHATNTEPVQAQLPTDAVRPEEEVASEAG